MSSDKEKCPECGSRDIVDRSDRNLMGRTVNWQECDQCGEIIDDSDKQSLEEFLTKKGHLTSENDVLEIPTSEMNKWVKEIAKDVLEWSKK